MTEARERLADLFGKEVVEESASNMARIVERVGLALLAEAFAGDSASGGLLARPMDEISSEEISWLWQDRIPFGMLSEIVGDPGEGKSFLTLAIAAVLSKGESLPGGGPNLPGVPRSSLLVCPEDSPSVTVRPRLERLGADLRKIQFVDGVPDPQTGMPLPLDLSNPNHRTLLRNSIREARASLVVIDPITAHLGKTNEWKDSEVRSVLAALARMAEETGAAIVLIRHLRKGGADRSIYRGLGSIAFSAVVRSSLIVGRPNGDGILKAVVLQKGNLCAPSRAMSFTIEDGGFRWEGEGPWTPEDLLQRDTGSASGSRLDETKEWLRMKLEGGPERAGVLFEQAKEAGISRATLRRAKSLLAVQANRAGGTAGAGHWIWSLPNAGDNTPKELTEPGYLGRETDEPLSQEQSPATDSNDSSPTKAPNNPLGENREHLRHTANNYCVLGCGNAVGRAGIPCARCAYQL